MIAGSENGNLLKRSRKIRATNKLSDPQTPMRFGYSVGHPEEKFSHFRQEQRDPSGVVRGSYGFKNPDGAFRLVQYIADGRGFRAHISSNEHGLGKQNPASVSINRFPQSSLTDTDKGSPKIPISDTRRVHGKVSETQEQDLQRIRHDFYAPVRSRTNSKVNPSRSFESMPPVVTLPITSSFYQSDSQKQVTPDFSHSWLNPNARYYEGGSGLRSKIPGETISAAGKLNHELNSGRWASSPFSEQLPKFPFLHNSFHKRLTPQDQNFQTNYGYDRFKLHEVALRSQSSDVGSSSNFPLPKYPANLHDDSMDMLSQMYPPLLKILLHTPQQKVHTSLPDCDTASSAVLCKPPLIFSDSYVERNTTNRVSDFPTNSEAHNTLGSFGRSIPGINTESLETMTLSRKSLSYPHLLPKSFPFQSDIYKSFLDLKQSEQETKRTDILCSNKNSAKGNSDMADTSMMEFDSKPYSTDSNDNNDLLQRFGIEYNKMMSSDLKENHLLRTTSRDELYNNENRLSLLSNRDKTDASNQKKNLLLIATQMSLKKLNKPVSNLLSNLNLLGILILPNEVDEDPSQDKPKYETIDEVHSSAADDNASGHNFFGDENAKYPLEESLEFVPHMGDDFSFDSKLEGDYHQGEVKLPKDTTSDGNNNSTTNENHQILTSKFGNDSVSNNAMELKNSGFLILDEAEPRIESNITNLAEKENHQIRNISTDWRKILEEEINKDYEKTELQRQARYPDYIPALLPDQPGDDTTPQQRVYNMQQQAGPLYDSRGVPVKPENVPIHIHRYIPPTGITSLPWKFSIPRPAPPRSIVVAPKPPNLS